MYRNATYQINKQANWRGEIRLDTWDEDGNPVTIVEPHKSFLYYEHPAGDKTSIYGTKLMRKEFNNTIERSKWIKNNPGRRLFECLPPVREYLLERYGGMQESPDFMQNPLLVDSLDIEVQSEDEFPLPEKAEYPINLITARRFYATADKAKHAELDKKSHNYIFIYTEGNYTFEQKPDRTYFIFNSEAAMLHAYVNWLHANPPDVITGWNIENFDIPYITNRIRNVLGDGMVALLSPISSVRPKKQKLKDVQNEVVSYFWEGIVILDYFFLYKTKMQVKRPYYKLEYVARKEKVTNKKKYEGSIKEFWKTDFVGFVEYNITDADIPAELERKLNFITQARLLCNIGLCEYEAIYKSAPYILGGIILQGRQMDKLVMTRDGSGDEEEEEYKGAFVFKPHIGFYNRGVFSLDLDSLYPNIIIMLNISPETKVGKVYDLGGGRFKINVYEKDYEFDSEAAMNAAMKGKLVRSANNILYINPELRKGVIPAFLERHYDERRSIKNEGKRLEKEAVKETDPTKKAILEAQAKLYDLYQNARKVMLNSTYGQLGSVYFPLFDKDSAEAITLTGQKIIRTAGSYFDEVIAKLVVKYKNDMSRLGNIGTIAGDTDSNYINGELLMREALGGRHPNFSDKAEVHLIASYLSTHAQAANSMLGEKIQQEFCLSPLKRLNFKLEKVGDMGTFIAAKNYVFHTLIKEGVEQYDNKGKFGKFHYTGVSIKKDELPDSIKDVLRDFVENGMLEGWDSKKYNERLLYYWNIYKQMSWDEVSFISTYGTHKDPDGFLEFAKGTHYVLKAVLTYNQILRKLGLHRRYEEAVINDKVRLCYINPDNEYHVECFAFPGEIPAEMAKKFKIDYEVMFEKTIFSKLKPFEAAFGWHRNATLNDYEISVEDL